MASFLMHLLFGILWVVASFAATTRQFSAYYLPSQTTQLLAADPAGNLFVVSTVGPAIRVSKTDASGKVLTTFVFGGSTQDAPAAAAIDPNGNLIIGGATASSDFPLVSPIQTTGSLSASAETWIRRQPGLKGPVIFVAEQRRVCLVRVEASISSNWLNYPPLADSRPSFHP
jgi:hypothetical protein